MAGPPVPPYPPKLSRIHAVEVARSRKGGTAERKKRQIPCELRSTERSEITHSRHLSVDSFCL
jgi:hypothetical protein